MSVQQFEKAVGLKALLAVGMGLLLMACTKEKPASVPVKRQVVEAAQRETSYVNSVLGQPNDGVAALVASYYSDRLTIAAATGALQEYVLPTTYSDEQQSMPYALSVLKRDIIDADTKEPISFANLSNDERASLLGAMLMEDYSRVCERLRVAPEALGGFAVRAMMQRRMVERMGSQPVAFDDFVRMSDEPSGNTQELRDVCAAIPMAVRGEQALEDLELAVLDEMSNGGDVEAIAYSQSVDDYLGQFGLNEAAMETQPRMEPARTALGAATVWVKWSESAEPGRILVRLAQHRKPGFRGNFSGWGHVAIFDDYVRTTFDLNKKTTYDADDEEGVHMRNVDGWACKHYVFRIDYVHYEYKKRRFRKDKKIFVYRRELDPSGVPAECAKHIGKGYVEGYDMLRMNTRVPRRFTCTTLAWYCVKRVLGVDISNDSKWFIFPSDVYLDENTRNVQTVE